MTDAPEPRDDEQVLPSDEPGAADTTSEQAEDDTPPAPDSTAAGMAGTPPVADMTAALEAAERQRDTYLDHLRRERAEFENFRKRSTRERSEATDRGAEALISRLLGVLDNFSYVLEAAKDHDDAVAKGVRMVHDELREVLSKAGLEDVPGVGAPFDPTWHDAVMQIEGETTDEGEPTVAQVLRTGYRFKGRVLRPASVAVTQ